MTCKKCNYHIKEEDWEYYVVHMLEAHGRRFVDTIDMLKNRSIEVNLNMIDEAWKAHKATGKVSAYRFKRGGLGNTK